MVEADKWLMLWKEEKRLIFAKIYIRFSKGLKTAYK